MARLILVTFAGTMAPRSRSWELRQRVLQRSALRHGFDAVEPWTRRRLTSTDFYRAHRDVLDQERGAGYWAWKPYVIRTTLEAADSGDHVVYWDVGRAQSDDTRVGNRFERSIRKLVRWCDRVGDGVLPGTWIPQTGPNARWTKRDAFVHMGCDQARYWFAPQVEATFSIWRREARSLAFLAMWQDYVTDARIVTDQPNTCGLPNRPGFVDHRHDQSVLTNLVLREGFRAPLCAGGASKDMNRLVRRIRFSGIRPRAAPSPARARAEASPPGSV